MSSGPRSENFPFKELRKFSEDYFDSPEECMAFHNLPSLDHVWSVSDHDGWVCYGPSHHFVNLSGFIGTKMPHDGNTYYQEDTRRDVSELVEDYVELRDSQHKDGITKDEANDIEEELTHLAIEIVERLAEDLNP